jgi:hypothetical protein
MAQALRAGLRNGGLRRGGLRPGLGNGNLFAIAPLDLFFARNRTLDSRVTFTRASSGTYVGSDGLIKTAATNEPRFDHNPTTGESLGLLVEEQRTNLLLQSEDLLTTWTANDGLARTANQTVSPNGSTTADLLASGGTLIGYLEQPNASSNQFVSGTTYTYSIYLKKANTSTCLTLLFGTTFNSGGGNPVATWNLDTGVPTFVNGATGSMTAVGNGWYRCVVTDTATQTHTQNQQWLRMASASGDVYTWGAQLEVGAFATSYIPTTTATVTRSADVPSITGANFSSWYRQDEGTVFSDCVGTFSATQVLVNTAATAANTATSAISLASNLVSSQKRVRIRDAASADQASLALGASSSGSRTRIAAAIKANDFAASLDGGAAVTDTTGTVPTVALMEIGSAPSGVTLGTQLHRRLTYWPTRLTNEVLQRITQ